MSCLADHPKYLQHLQHLNSPSSPDLTPPVYHSSPFFLYHAFLILPSNTPQLPSHPTDTMKNLILPALLLLASIANAMPALFDQANGLLLARTDGVPSGKCLAYSIQAQGKALSRVKDKRKQVPIQDCDPECKSRAKVNADKQIHSSSCIASGQISYNQKDKDGDFYALGNCKCDDAVINAIGKLVVEDILPAVGSIACTVWLTAFEKILEKTLEIGTYLIPGAGEASAVSAAMRTAVTAAKTIAKNGAKSDKFTGWIAKVCPKMPKTEKVFDILQKAPDSFAKGKCLPNTSCK